MMRFEAPDLAVLAVTLDSAADDALPEARKVVAKGLLNIKNGARRRVTGLQHAPAYPYSITYDMDPGEASGEVGADKSKRQGALGNLIEYGSVHNPPRPHIGPEADAELPRFTKAIQDLAVEALED